MQVITDRRNLHRIPELDRDLPRTTAYVREALAHLKCEVTVPMEGAVCALFDFGREDTVAFRADLDALPIAERTGVEYASTHPGKMHACGHDGHTAMLLELARRLNEKQTLPHNVLLLFQPAEETIGAAKDLCETGVLEKYSVCAVFGMHLWPGVPLGQVVSRRGALMARSCEVNIDVFGVSSHIAKAKQGRDALAAGAEIYRRVTEMEQSLPGDVLRLLKFGKFQSGTVRNALSAYTRIEGSLRAFQDDVFEALQQNLRSIAARVGEETGCSVEVTMTDGYPPVWNPEPLYDRVRSFVEFGELEEPSMTSEDFSFYMRRVPGMFFFLGTGDTPALHADTFDFDDAILVKGVDFLEQLGERFL